MLRGGEVLLDFGEEEGVVGAAEDDGVDGGVEGEELAEVFLDEVVGAGGVGFAALDEGDPHGAGELGDGHLRGDLFEFEEVGVAGDCAGGGEEADVACAGDGWEDFDCGADDAEDAAEGEAVGAEGGLDEVVLLDGAEGFCGGGVAGEDHEAAIEREEGFYGLEGEVVDDIEGARAVGGSGVVAEVDIVVLREECANFAQDCQTSVA